MLLKKYINVWGTKALCLKHLKFDFRRKGFAINIADSFEWYKCLMFDYCFSSLILSNILPTIHFFHSNRPSTNLFLFCSGCIYKYTQACIYLLVLKNGPDGLIWKDKSSCLLFWKPLKRYKFIDILAIVYQAFTSFSRVIYQVFTCIRCKWNSCYWNHDLNLHSQ